MKRFIIFRNDRLGDFLILTNIIKKIKDKYKDAHITIVASSFNYKFIKNYKIIDKVYLYNRTDSFFYKISLIRDLFKNKYYASFSVDGKSFSNFCNFIIKSKFKLGLVYKFKFLNIWLTKPNFLYNYLIFDKYETFTSKKYLTKIEHLPTKLINLANFLNLEIKLNDNYYFEVSKKEQIKFSKSKYFKKKYILFHLDEKWTDIEQVNIKLYENLLFLSRKSKKIIIITSFKNNFNYFKNLKKKINNNKSKNIYIVENSNLYFFERLIKHSLFSISCHSGYLVQVAGSNSSNIIDIINKVDYKWYSSWKPLNTKHKFIYKSSINLIFNNLILYINSFNND
jgi:ADP-heptose:LPS heptosyltransferase